MATTGTTSSRRSRTAKAANGTSAVNNTKQSAEESAEYLEETMAEQEKTIDNGGKAGTLELAKSPKDNKSGSGAIEVSKGGSVIGSPVASGELEIAELFSEAGLRPIGASHMEVFGTILNGRPIMASHLRVMDYSSGQRPVFASDMVVRDELTLPGGRPIVASDPKLMESSLLPGGRPIASNVIDDSEALMGFLD